ncbi:unnamed protein product [Clonostachys rosea f. rosea IK726]|uniref:Uncharacterized protein n=1 Tax=Clonostachys rosea f. rosea IK726 TaxID=1349383 RepID=A0ACA9UQ70_BIOOC|nr:unnamed protein product [Clonostachys rosea f. rosea IK726]
MARHNIDSGGQVYETVVRGRRKNEPPKRRLPHVRRIRVPSDILTEDVEIRRRRDVVGLTENQQNGHVDAGPDLSPRLPGPGAAVVLEGRRDAVDEPLPHGRARLHVVPVLDPLDVGSGVRLEPLGHAAGDVEDPGGQARQRPEDPGCGWRELLGRRARGDVAHDVVPDPGWVGACPAGELGAYGAAHALAVEDDAIVLAELAGDHVDDLDERLEAVCAPGLRVKG